MQNTKLENAVKFPVSHSIGAKQYTDQDELVWKCKP